MISLIVTDVGHTLGTFAGPSTAEFLRALSPLDLATIAEETRRVLHRQRALTAEHITDLCAALLIDPDSWPDPWPTSGFEPFPYTNAALADLKSIAPIEALSNLPVTTGPSRMKALAAACGHHIDRIHTSYQRGMRKPDHRLWRAIAIERGVRPEDIVHIGDQWHQDILGAVAAGCRAIHVNTGHRPVPPPHTWPAGQDRIGLADNLRGALDILRQW